MITYINSKLLPYITPIIIFCITFLSGCSSGGALTVDNEELFENIDDIQIVYSFKLNQGTVYSNKNGNIYLNKWDRSNPLMIYNPFELQTDSLGNNSKDQKEMEFSFKNIKSAKVKLKEGEYATVWNVLGGILILSFILLFLSINTNRK